MQSNRPVISLYDEWTLSTPKRPLKVAICLDRPASKLDRDLTREHTAWDGRQESKSEEKRERFQAEQGAHVYWGYLSAGEGITKDIHYNKLARIETGAQGVDKADLDCI